MTDVRERLEALLRELDSMDDEATVSGVPDESSGIRWTTARVRELVEPILAAMDEPRQGLPWVSDRLPTEDDADEFGGVVWHDGQGRTDVPWWTASWNNEQSIAMHTHWCRCDAIPLPGSGGWIDAGKWCPLLETRTDVMERMIQDDDPSVYRVALLRLDGEEEG